MKIIHCSDVHLDSKLAANLSSDKALEQRNYLLSQFSKFVTAAKEQGVRIILIAGDLFDSQHPTLKSRDYVLDTVKKSPDIDFLYLAGNHEKQGLFSGLSDMPKNFIIFGDEWQSVEYGNICISSAFMSDELGDAFYDGLKLDTDKFNIVMLHGEVQSRSGADTVNIRLLKNKGIDYLALGHYHTYSEVELDKRGTGAYSGCLFGRGFDECGEKGYILLDIDEEKRKFTREWVVFPSRLLCETEVDISGLEKYSEIRGAVAQSIESIPSDSLVKIVLIGEQSPQSQRDLSHLTEDFKSNFYFLKIYDETVPKKDYSDYLNDISLRGEFIRLIVGDDSLTDTEKRDILNYGYKALSGEDFPV